MQAKAIPTVEPNVVILARSENHIVYHNERDDETWIIHGKCNQCGQCEVGAAADANDRIIWTGIPVGEPFACYDKTFSTRKDVPVRPEINIDNDKCTLSGEYLK